MMSVGGQISQLRKTYWFDIDCFEHQANLVDGASLKRADEALETLEPGKGIKFYSRMLSSEEQQVTCMWCWAEMKLTFGVTMGE